MTMRDALHQTLQQRVYGSVSPDLLFKRARGSKYLLQCLQRNGTLTGHEGCVNTIAWSDSGDLLLSGSDDCRLNVYRPYQRKLLQNIRTGHRANIFSAKFLPYTADKKIVSCAGDGMIQLIDLDKPESHGKCSYNCHAGTAYEVITTPGDSNTFISCGEDGTVRMFDIRTKARCAARDCKEDVLIDCGKAVTSLGLNPLAPYQLGIGCEDSAVALFDRRSLSTANSSNAMKGMLCKFKPDALKDRTCRVTSLEFSSDGCELLVSYCADYIYLFNVRGEREIRYPCDAAGHENGAYSNHDRKKNLPLKRLRLRGDWSDTGPNARPESEAASTESTLMQRMSDLFVRWIEESFRGNQRNRLRTASQTRSESSSSSASSPPSLPPRTSNDSSSESSRTTSNTSEPNLCVEGTSHQESADVTIDELTEDCFETASSGSSKTLDTENQKTDDHVCDMNDGRMDFDQTAAGASGVKIEIISANAKKNLDKNDDGKEDIPGSDQEDIEIQADVESSAAPGSDDGSLDKRYCSQGSNDTRSGKVSGGASESRGQVSQGMPKTRGEASQGEAGSRGEVSQGVTETRGEASPSGITNESTSSDYDEAATRIQRVFRNYRLIKNFDRADKSCGTDQSGQEKEFWIPKMTRVYRGHRNARTMIKEARFWGDGFIVSGSDCGRIFIWDKDTTEIVMILQGDRHVVNCVQPHPFDPVLASSGIDYDIKLWAPTAEEPLQIDGLDEIIKRNEQMLEESRDTITVPASFMLRMLASLNHARFARTNQDDSDTDSTEDG